MEQGNGHYELMEARLQCGSLRYKSKVPRARGSHLQNPDYAECTIPTLLKRDSHSPRDHLSSPKDHNPPSRDPLLSPRDQHPTSKDYQSRDHLPSSRIQHPPPRRDHHPSSRDHPKNHHPSLRSHHPRDHQPSVKELTRDHQGMLDLGGDTDEQKEWRQLVGQRVCISGVKQGTLRYFGRTNFAQGHWCGVELDEAVGKNDGTVSGVVYFACRPNHGIFAPVGKVSRLNDTWRPDSETPSTWRSESVKQETSRGWDYNLEESSANKCIRNSISDPTFMQGNVKSSVPRGSESFSFDKRDFAETSKTYTKQSVKNSSSTRSLSKYGYAKKNQYLSSNVITLGDNAREMQPRQLNNGNGQNKGLTAAMEEYEHFLRTPTNSGQASPMSSEATAAKRFNEMPFYDYGKMPDAFLNAFQSHDFSDFEDEVDNDDQMSVDYDESLGILTPSQMKDLTLGTDFPTSLSDIRGLDFPSSESFDDINDLPEDEQVHDVSVFRVSEPSTTRSLEVSKQNGSGSYNKNIKVADAEKVHMSSTDKFLYSISQKDSEGFHVDSRFASTASEEFRFISTDNYTRTYNVNDLSTANVLCSEKVCNSDEQMSEKYYKTFSKEETSNIVRIQNNAELQSNVCVTQPLLPEADHNMMEIDQKPACCNQSDNSQSKVVNEDKSRQNGDSLLSVEPDSNTTLKEKLTVSWEDCLSRDSECMFPHVERPESVYTVGSSDTGFHEDGELEIGMTTSIDSATDETKRFSSASRDSCCVVSDEADAYKIAESNSTSGYSTGLSDSCCNDRADDDLSSKPLTDEEVQDSVEHCDSEDAFSFQENSLGRDGDMADNMETSEVTPENVTAVVNDSTSDALCETMVEDSTLTEINELLMSPEENAGKTQKSPVAEEMEVIAEQQETVKVVAILHQESADSKLSTSNSPARSTPERKPISTRARTTTSTRNSSTPGSYRSSRASRDEEIEKKRQQVVVPKSPKKNVMSKIKAMIEATSCKSVGRNNKAEAEPMAARRTVSAPKKSRWEAVTSKIAASLAEEKTKPKARREIKSRVDTNLTTARQLPCKTPNLDSCRASNCGDGSMSPVSVCSRDRRPLADKNSAPNSVREGRTNLARDSKQRPKSPRPGRITASRSASPDVAASESSASVSIHSYSHTSKSKTAHWKGSNSTIASSIPPPPVNKRPPPIASTKATSVTRAALTTTRTINKKPPTVPKIRITPSDRSQSPVIAKRTERSKRHSRTSKEHAGRVSSHLSTSKQPARPTAWLSKAELTQEIQRLGTLCEARTKELNRLKMETKHVTVGFDAFAALFKYMVEDVNGLSVPKLSEELGKTLKQLELAKQDLAYYEREVEEMKAHHCQELNDLSNKLFEVFQGEVTELGTKHQEEVNRLKQEHELQLQATSEMYKVGSEETQACHEAAVMKLQQELITQSEELQLFHEKELLELEQKHCESTKTLQEHIEQLQKKCAELKHHSLGMEDAMRKDTDTKLQWVTSRKGDLEKEVESLKAVLEMKNKELHTIRVQNLEMQKQMEDLPLAREKIKMLSARAEDLEALMAEKTRLERKLSTENQTIRDTYEKESKVNKRLSMENEELQWRLRQAEQSIISGSFTEVAESAEEMENCPLSPVKSPPQMSRSVFFTFVDKDNSSPRSQYKKITPGFSSGYKTSPSKSSAPSPRRGRGLSEPLQPSGSTPKKTTLKQQKRQRAGTSDNGGAQSFASSMVSSVGSESSVFDQREELLEEHKEQIMETLEILREQRCSEENDGELTPCRDIPEQNGRRPVTEEDCFGDVPCQEDGEVEYPDGLIEQQVSLKQNGDSGVLDENPSLSNRNGERSDSKTTWHDVRQNGGEFVLDVGPESPEGLEQPVASDEEKMCFPEEINENGSDAMTPSDKWQEEVAKRIAFDGDEMSRSAEFSDPKTYYHMTFPVLKEAGAQDCDPEDATKDGFATAQATHSMVESSEVVRHATQAPKEASLGAAFVSLQENGASTAIGKVLQQHALSQSCHSTENVQDSECKERSREKNRWRTM